LFGNELWISIKKLGENIIIKLNNIFSFPAEIASEEIVVLLFIFASLSFGSVAYFICIKILKGLINNEVPDFSIITNDAGNPLEFKKTKYKIASIIYLSFISLILISTYFLNLIDSNSLLLLLLRSLIFVTLWLWVLSPLIKNILLKKINAKRHSIIKYTSEFEIFEKKLIYSWDYTLKEKTVKNFGNFLTVFFLLSLRE
jgi:hypothetical protein